jgi:hypothetical protein
LLQVQRRWRSHLLNRQGSANMRVVRTQRRAARNIPRPRRRHLDRRRRPDIHHPSLRLGRQHHQAMGPQERQVSQDMGVPDGRQARRVQRGRHETARRHGEAYGTSGNHCRAGHRGRCRGRTERGEGHDDCLRGEQGDCCRVELPQQVYCCRTRGWIGFSIRRQDRRSTHQLQHP